MGKTTIASKFPKSLLLGFEKGWAAIPGIMVQPINTWGEFRQVINQLKDPDVQNTYYNIIIDTVDVSYSLCEKYICDYNSDAEHDYDNVASIPYGKYLPLFKVI